MSQEELFESLEKLKSEIEKLAGADEAVKLKLATLVTDAITQVGSPHDAEEVSSEDQTLSEKISDVIGEFETEHPQITELISRITNSLSDLGI